MRNVLTMEVSLKYDGYLLDHVEVVKKERQPLPLFRWSRRYTAAELLRCTVGQKAADQTKWNVPAHQALANLTAFNFHEHDSFLSFTTWPSMGEVNPKALREFVMRYGPLSSPTLISPTLSSPVDVIPHEPPPTVIEDFPIPWNYLRPVAAPNVIIEDPTEVCLKQFVLRKAWCEKSIMVGLLHEQGEPFFPVSINTRVVMKPEGVEIVVRDLWSFIRLSFLRDYYHGLTAICKLPSCPAPYFLQHGRRRMYCSHKCAMADSSRAYRERVRKEERERLRKEVEAEVRKELKTKEEEM